MLVAVMALGMVSGVSAAAPNNIVQIKHINVQINDTFNIKLVSNPSTGYSWNEKFNSSKIAMINNKFVPNTDKTLMGAPGMQEFTFKAVELGHTKIVMDYKCLWSDTDGKKIVYYVNVMRKT